MRNLRLCFSLVAASGLSVLPGFGQASPHDPGVATVQVTATRFPEDPAKVPASITVITGQEIRDRGKDCRPIGRADGRGLTGGRR